MKTEQLQIQGYCADGKGKIADTFAENFQHHQEQGAALAVYKDGDLVANLWAGTRDKAETLPWEAATRVNIFSASKAFTAVCILQLIEQGKLQLDTPVADYWPEFAEAQKEAITLRHVLCHRSGVSAFHEKIEDEVIYDWSAVTGAIAREQPWWSPGTQQGYSPILFGWILGEVVRRVSGFETFNAYFQSAIAQPLGIDACFGLPTEQLESVADVGAQKKRKGGSSQFTELMNRQPDGISAKAFSNPLSILVGINSPRWRQAQIPAANGQASAASLGKFYNALITGDSTLLSSSFKPLLWEEQSNGEDKVLATFLRFSLGFMLRQERDDCRFGMGENSFGHPGAGGCLGFADPEYGIGFGYVTNRMGQNLLVDERAQRLADAVYQSF